MRTKKFFTATVGWALAVFAIAVPQTSFAVAYIVPATVCQVWGGDAPAYADYIQYSKQGRAYNMHTSENVSVVCPIQRGFNSTHVDVTVFVVDKNNGNGDTADLTCGVYSNNAWGNSTVSYSGTYSCAEDCFTSGGVKSAKWTWNNLSVTNGTYPRNMVLRCNIPPRAGTQQSYIGTIMVDD